MSADELLVTIFLRGGADALALVPPVGDPDHRSARGELAVPDDVALAVDDHFALHPALRSLHSRVGTGTVALVPAVGLPELSRSHFDAQFRVEEAGPATGATTGTGWLGRHLASTAGQDTNPFRGVAFGGAGVPHLLAGSTDTIAATSLAGLTIDGTRRRGRSAPGVDLADRVTRMWTAAEDSALRDAALAGLGAVRIAEGLAADPPSGRSGGTQQAGGGLGGGRGSGGTATADIAAVVAAGLGTEVAVIDLGGWDTHAQQGVIEGTFATLVAALDTTIEAVLAEVPNATVLVLSEFGRRVAPNSSGGTDHGRGGVAILVGPTVAGGVKGDWPGLSELDDGDVRVANDLRTVLREVTAGVLGSDPDEVVGPPTGPDLGLFT